MRKHKENILRIAIYTMSTVLVATLFIIGAHADPLQCFAAFFKGIFGSEHGFAEVFVKATPLMLAGLGIAVGMNTGFFNIGAEGQMYIGAIAATVVCTNLSALPSVVQIILAMLAAFVAAGIWAFIPGILKAKFGISEIINTLMFNYIAYHLTGILIRGALQDPTGYLPQSVYIDTALSCIWQPTRLTTAFLIAIVCLLLVWWIMQRTTLGFELQITGSNRRAAQCVGIPVVRCLIIGAFLCGGLSGLAGTGELLGIQHRLLEGLAGSVGYTAVLVALLGQNKPLGVCIASVAFAALQVGANSMQRHMGIPAAIVSVITGFLVLLLLCDKIITKMIHRKGAAGCE